MEYEDVKVGMNVRVNKSSKYSDTHLTVGKIYEIVDKRNVSVYVVNDFGERDGYDPYAFDPVEETKFEAGQKVRCVNADNSLTGPVPLKLNEIYTVWKTPGDRVAVEGVGGWSFNSWRFEPVEEDHGFKVGDWVKCTNGFWCSTAPYGEGEPREIAQIKDGRFLGTRCIGANCDFNQGESLCLELNHYILVESPKEKSLTDRFKVGQRVKMNNPDHDFISGFGRVIDVDGDYVRVKYDSGTIQRYSENVGLTKYLEIIEDEPVTKYRIISTPHPGDNHIPMHLRIDWAKPDAEFTYKGEIYMEQKLLDEICEQLKIVVVGEEGSHYILSDGRVGGFRQANIKVPITPKDNKMLVKRLPSPIRDRAFLDVDEGCDIEFITYEFVESTESKERRETLQSQSEKKTKK